MNLKSLAVLTLAVSTNSFAGSMGQVVESAHHFYLGGEGGASISLNTNFSPGAQQYNYTNYSYVPTNWDYTTNFGIGGIGGVFVGYQHNANLALQFTYDYRGGYSLYKNLKSWNNLAQAEEYYYIKANGISFQSFLFDLILSPDVSWGGFVPYVKGGIGLSLNAIGTRHGPSRGLLGNANDTHIFGTSTTSFSWDVGIGANYCLTDKLSIGLGYRFVDVGGLTTSDRFSYESTQGNNQSGLIAPWTASNVFLNELLASVTYHFDWV